MKSTTAYFGKRNGPALGSWAAGFNFISLFLGYDLNKGRAITDSAFEDPSTR